MKTWLKGGLIGLAIWILIGWLFVASSIITPIKTTDYLSEEKSPPNPLNYFLTLPIIIIIGVVVGLVIQKVKNK